MKMIKMTKLLQIVEFAICNKFDVEIKTDDMIDKVKLKLSRGDIIIQYTSSGNLFYVEGVEFNQSFYETGNNLVNKLININEYTEKDIV